MATSEYTEIELNSQENEVQEVSCLKFIFYNMWLDCFYGTFIDDPYCLCCDNIGYNGSPSGHFYVSCPYCHPGGWFDTITSFGCLLLIIGLSFSFAMIILSIPILMSIYIPMFAYIFWPIVALIIMIILCLIGGRTLMKKLYKVRTVETIESA